MNRVFVLLIVLFGCEKLKPESVNIPEYPDLEQVYRQQIQSLASSTLQKEVTLDGKSESKRLEMDTISWKKELGFLNEINPNTPEYVGAFAKKEAGSVTVLTLNPDEKGEVKMISYSRDSIGFTTIEATIHEDKEVYSHHRDFDIQFENGLLKSYIINGYQKIVLKDTIRFRIEGIVSKAIK